jgi:hypothetical protein
MVYGTGGDEFDGLNVVGSVGVKTAVRLCGPTVREVVEVVAVPAVTLTAGPRGALSDWN